MSTPELRRRGPAAKKAAASPAAKPAASADVADSAPGRRPPPPREADTFEGVSFIRVLGLIFFILLGAIPAVYLKWYTDIFKNDKGYSFSIGGEKRVERNAARSAASAAAAARSAAAASARSSGLVPSAENTFRRYPLPTGGWDQARSEVVTAIQVRSRLLLPGLCR